MVAGVNYIRQHEDTEIERGRRVVVEESGDTKASRGPTCPWQQQRWNRAKEEEVCLVCQWVYDSIS